ncbi:uncharacterized protein LOC131675684 [Phymastichus coffea]|uniref:uncharacterized protein LOC131675684 n=1 Tax=Phymastichus coffea TaxID=108790 RepID=UPI00273BA120|nr:uncharacterized protein LOC131675684 [Phymastichus coffea]
MARPRAFPSLGCLLLLALGGSAIQLQQQQKTTTTTSSTTSGPTTATEPAAAAAAPAAAEPSSQPSGNSDEPFTTKRNAQVFFDLPKNSPFPLPVANEVKPTASLSNAASKSAGGAGAAKPAVAAAAPPTTVKPTTPPRRGTAELPLYRLNSSNGQACILLQVDALITIKYRTKLGEEKEADVYVPNGATVTGSCDNENFVVMSLKWDTFILSWAFAKTPGGERWYVDKIELTYNTSDKHFEHIDQPSKTVRVNNAQRHHSSMLFPTPVGKSYACDEEQEIALTDGKVHASVLLRTMKLQPFKFKSNDFASEFSCSALYARANRDETAPVAVGSTLAAVVLLTITGYAGWRYFKIKKVKYDTME